MTEERLTEIRLLIIQNRLEKGPFAELLQELVNEIDRLKAIGN